MGNLNFDTTEGDVHKLFSEVGEVEEVFLPTDRNTGRPRGFAFVRFADASSLEKAIQQFDGTELQGRNIRVNEAEERRPRPQPNYQEAPHRDPWSRPGKSKGSRRNLRKRKRGF